MHVYLFLKATLGVFSKIFWIGKVEGKHNVPRRGAVIIAPNHQSWLDFGFLATVLNRRLYFLIAAFIYKNPIFRFALKQMKHIKVDLDEDGRKRVYDEAKNTLSKGGALVVFPEGWMTRDGYTRRAYLGVARMALASKVDIVPTVIRSYHIYPYHQKLPSLRNGRCDIKFLERLRYEDFKDKDASHIVHDLLMPAIVAELKHEYPKEEVVTSSKKVKEAV